MSESSRLIQVAQVLKSNGTDGEVLMGFRNIDPDDINLQEPVFIEFDGLPVPYFMESFTRRGTSKALVRLTGVRSLSDAGELCGSAVYADRDTLSLEEDEEVLDLDALVGWTVFRAAPGTPDSPSTPAAPDASAPIPVGTITGYEDIPGNPCIYVSVRTDKNSVPGGPVLLPLHDDLIADIDEEARLLTLVIPEGLL